MTVNLRNFADEINLRHDSIDKERDAIGAIYDELRDELREDGCGKDDVRQTVADLKELIAARRKYGEGLDGYESKSARVLNLSMALYGGREQNNAPARKSAPLKGLPEKSAPTRGRDAEIAADLAAVEMASSSPSAAVSSPPKPDSSGAAVLALPGTAALNSDGGGEVGEGPSANSNKDSLAAPMSAAGGGCGVGEPAAALDNPYNCIPDFCLRT